MTFNHLIAKATSYGVVASFAVNLFFCQNLAAAHPDVDPGRFSKVALGGAAALGVSGLAGGIAGSMGATATSVSVPTAVVLSAHASAIATAATLGALAATGYGAAAILGSYALYKGGQYVYHRSKYAKPFYFVTAASKNLSDSKVQKMLSDHAQRVCTRRYGRMNFQPTFAPYVNSNVKDVVRLNDVRRDNDNRFFNKKVTRIGRPRNDQWNYSITDLQCFSDAQLGEQPADWGEEEPSTTASLNKKTLPRWVPIHRDTSGLSSSAY